MQKKILTKDLRPGMYVADVGRGWLNHPWKTKSKLISDFDEIKELLDLGINEVTVDFEKSKPTELTEKDNKSLKNGKAEKKSSEINKSPLIKTGRETLSAVEEELPKATKAYTKALDTSKALVAACRMNKKIELKEVEENVNGLVESVSRNRDALMALMKLRRFDDYTYTHSLNVSVLAISAGKSLGLSDEELKILGLGTMFHDLGKTRIPGHILNKPGKLTDEEFVIMKNHAALSGDIIVEQKLKVDDTVFKIARHHHERNDGSGYPDKLTGEKIPHLVTICALSDVYDALTSDRVYHKGRSPHEALKIIYGLRDVHFQGQWVDRFVQSVGIYPPGTVVLLSSGQIAVVMEINQNALNSPLLKLIAAPDGMIYSRPKLLDLSSESETLDIKIKKVIPREESGFDPAYYFNAPKD